MKRSLLSSLLLLALGAGNIRAQTSGESAETSLRKLLERVESLETEVRQLRTDKAMTPRRSGKETVPSAESETPTPVEGALHTSYPQLKIRGFGDVEYHWADRGPDRNAFRLGQLDRRQGHAIC